MDNVTKAKRSWIMSRIKSRGTKPELLMRGMLLDMEEVFTEHAGELPGRPDFKIVSARTALFIQGCFFHGCRLHCKFPKTNRGFWTHKIFNNMRRDVRVVKALWRRGWHVVRVWEHSMRPGCAESTYKRLLNRLQRNRSLSDFTGPRARRRCESEAQSHA